MKFEYLSFAVKSFKDECHSFGSELSFTGFTHKLKIWVDCDNSIGKYKHDYCGQDYLDGIRRSLYKDEDALIVTIKTDLHLEYTGFCADGYLFDDGSLHIVFYNGIRFKNVILHHGEYKFKVIERVYAQEDDYYNEYKEYACF